MKGPGGGSGGRKLGAEVDYPRPLDVRMGRAGAEVTPHVEGPVLEDSMAPSEREQ